MKNKHKNKKMKILAASLVLSLTLSVAVTDRVKGREEGKSATLWAQMAESALQTFGKGVENPKGDAILPVEEPVDSGVETPSVKGSVPAVTKREAPEEVPDMTTPETGKKAPESRLPEAALSPGTTGQEVKEGVLPEKDVPRPAEATEPAAGKDPGTVEMPGKDGTGPAPVPESGAQGNAVAEAAPREKAVGRTSGSAPASEGGAWASRDVILQLTTAAENSRTRLQYNHAEALPDGKGITFGIMGFRTGTHEGNELIRHYTKLNRENRLAGYLPALNDLEKMPGMGENDAASDRMAGLEGFLEEIRDNTDPLFFEAQTDMLNQFYWYPAVKLMDRIGAENPLTLAFLYDMMVSHGEEGAEKFISKADYALGGTPLKGVDEEVFLMKLMDLRESYLDNTGKAHVDRVAAFRGILTSGNVALTTPFSFTVNGATFRIDGKTP